MPKSDDIEILLLRSGRTAWDEASRVQGQTDLPMTEAGRAEVAAVIRDLLAAGARPALVHASQDEAASETARMLAQEAGARLRLEPDLATCHLGLWEGLLEDEIAERFPSACKQWQDQPSCIHPPEGEPFEAASQRIRLALARALDRAGDRPTAFVLRPLPYALAICWLTGRPTKDIWTVIKDGPFSSRLRFTAAELRRVIDEASVRV
ncbi:MAG: histidine phosphatase family protein [Planctomycetota bacterium]|nr:histidine phosphatase family protein [Planctomycetota bacterium]